MRRFAHTAINRKSGISILLILAILLVGCSPGQRAGIGRAFGIADDVIRPYLDDFAITVGDDAANASITRIGQHVDDGIAALAAAGSDVPAEIRSSFTGVVCETLIFAIQNGAWPSQEAIAAYIVDEIGGALSEQYNARDVADASLTVAGNVLAQTDIDQEAATNVVCAAAGYVVSR